MTLPVSMEDECSYSPDSLPLLCVSPKETGFPVKPSDVTGNGIPIEYDSRSRNPYGVEGSERSEDTNGVSFTRDPLQTSPRSYPSVLSTIRGPSYHRL